MISPGMTTGVLRALVFLCLVIRGACTTQQEATPMEMMRQLPRGYCKEIREIIFDPKRNTTIPKIAVVISKELDDEVRESYYIENNEGYVLAPRPEPGLCVKINILIVKVDNSTSHGIYNETVLAKLKEADFLVGERLESVQSWVSSDGLSKPYFITSPLGPLTETNLENLVARSQDSKRPSMTYSLWPSPTVFAAAVGSNIHLLTSHVTGMKKIFIIAYAQSEESIVFVDRLEKEIRIQTMGLIYTYDLYKTANKLRSVDENFTANTEAIFNANTDIRQKMKALDENLAANTETIFNVTTDIRQKMKAHGTDIVLLYLDPDMPLAQKIRILRVLFSNGADLDREDMPWLFADMTFTYEPGAMTKLDKIPVLKTRLYLMDVSMSANIQNSSASIHKFKYSKPVQDGVVKNGLLKARGLIAAIAEKYKARAENEKYEARDEEPPENYKVRLMKTIGDYFQTHCPEIQQSPEQEINPESQNNGPDATCPVVNSLHTVGFPKFNLIKTIRVRPRASPVKNLTTLQDTEIISVFSDYELYTEYYVDNFANITEKIVRKDHYLFGRKEQEANVFYAVLIQDKPFVMKHSDGTYEGLAIDIYNAVKNEILKDGIILDLKFKDADVYGRKIDNVWNGVFGEIKDSENVVLGIGQISITDERTADKAFTFTTPFGYTSVTYMAKNKIRYNTLLQFLRPFTVNVWFGLALVFVFSGIYLYMMDVWNPFDDDIPEDNRFNGNESFWHSYLVITQSGAPFGAFVYPARVYSVFYWFFALVVVGCYTGNLASFLSDREMVTPDIPTLLKEGNRFGTLSHTSVTSDDIHRVLGHQHHHDHLDDSHMETVRNYSEGVRKIKEEDFILVGTSLVMTSYRNSDDNCSLTVGKSDYFNRESQALAFPLNASWEHASAFKRAMARLQEDGQLQLLYNKWIEFNAKCVLKDKDEDTNRLGWENFSGLFVLISAGSVVSYLVLALKLTHLTLKKRQKKRANNADQNDAKQPLTTVLSETKENDKVMEAFV